MRKSWVIVIGVILMGAAAQIVGAQTPQTEQPTPPSQKQSTGGTSVRAGAEKRNLWIDPSKDHHFWDKQNDWLFAAVAASRTFDYFSTLNLRRRGDQEILVTNDLVDDHAAFAVVEAAGTGVSIGASYLFHCYGHHKLERWTSIVHFGLATGGAVRNYCLKTAHPKR